MKFEEAYKSGKPFKRTCHSEEEWLISKPGLDFRGAYSCREGECWSLNSGKYYRFLPPKADREADDWDIK